MRPELASHTRFFSIRTAKQLSLTCFISMVRFLMTLHEPDARTQSTGMIASAHQAGGVGWTGV